MFYLVVYIEALYIRSVLSHDHVNKVVHSDVLISHKHLTIEYLVVSQNAASTLLATSTGLCEAMILTCRASSGQVHSSEAIET